MFRNSGPALILAALLVAVPVISAPAQNENRNRVITRRGTNDTSPSVRVYTNVPGVGIVGYTDAETRWINQVDQLLGQYQLQNPNPIGSSQWINYIDSLVEWYQQQNPFDYGTANWQAYNNRIFDWYQRQNPYQQGTPDWQNYASRITGVDQSEIYARPREFTFDEYMQDVYRTNPYPVGSTEWTQYTNFYINEYNRLYGTSDVTADGQPLTPQWQQYPQQQPWTQGPSTMAPTGTTIPYTQPPSTTPQQDWTLPQRVTTPSSVPQQDWTQQPWGAGVPQQQTAPQTALPPSTGMTPMVPGAPPSPGAISGGTAGAPVPVSPGAISGGTAGPGAVGGGGAAGGGGR